MAVHCGSANIRFENMDVIEVEQTGGSKGTNAAHRVVRPIDGYAAVAACLRIEHEGQLLTQGDIDWGVKKAVIRDDD